MKEDKKDKLAKRLRKETKDEKITKAVLNKILDGQEPPLKLKRTAASSNYNTKELKTFPDQPYLLDAEEIEKRLTEENLT